MAIATTVNKTKEMVSLVINYITCLTVLYTFTLIFVILNFIIINFHVFDSPGMHLLKPYPWLISRRP